MSAPIRVLELRSVRGIGGGPEKTILAGAAQADSNRFAITVCYVRDRRDMIFAIDQRARSLGIDYVEVHEKHSLDPRVWPALRQLVRERQIDIVHAHDYKTDLFAYLLGRFEHVIPMSTVHGWSGVTWREKLYYKADRRLLARFPGIVAVSSLIRDQLIAAGARPNTIRTIPNGIDPVAFHRDPSRVDATRIDLGLAPGEFAIGSIGRLESEKRMDVLIEAFALVYRHYSNCRLFFAGVGSLQTALEQLAERLGIASACRFLGHCPDVAAVYHALDLFVQSSDTEGTSNAVLEAMAYEVPIVATAVGGTSDLIKDGVHGLLVPPRDATALAGAIEQTIDAPTATRQRCVAARHRIEQELSFKSRMQAVESLYEELMTTHGR